MKTGTYRGANRALIRLVAKTLQPSHSCAHVSALVLRFSRSDMYFKTSTHNQPQPGALLSFVSTFQTCGLTSLQIQSRVYAHT